MLHSGLLPLACSNCFLAQPEHGRLGPPTSIIDQENVPMGQSNVTSSSVEVPGDSSLCQLNNDYPACFPLPHIDLTRVGVIVFITEEL